MSAIQKICNSLGSQYVITTIDNELVIYRKLENGCQFEVSGIKSLTGKCTLYVWAATHQEVIGIYDNIQIHFLEDVLGYYTTKYQNLTAGIQVLRED